MLEDVKYRIKEINIKPGENLLNLIIINQAEIIAQKKKNY